MRDEDFFHSHAISLLMIIFYKTKMRVHRLRNRSGRKDVALIINEIIRQTPARKKSSSSICKIKGRDFLHLPTRSSKLATPLAMH